MEPIADRRIEIPDDVLMRELQGESVLLNLATESYFGLDEVGTRMWSALSASSSTAAAFEVLLAEYEVSPEDLRRDLADFVDRLAAAGLVRVAAA